MDNKAPIPINKNTTPIEKVKEALNIIITYPQWGGQSISDYLLNEQIVHVSYGTAQKIKNKVKELINNQEQQQELKFVTRYEALAANDIWAMDFMQFEWYGETLYIPIIIDSYSRFMLGWKITDSPTTELVLNLVDRAITTHQAPKVIKSDNGPQFRENFVDELEEREIFHLNSPSFTPQYNGKAERKIKDLRSVIEKVKHLKWGVTVFSLNGYSNIAFCSPDNIDLPIFRVFRGSVPSAYCLSPTILLFYA